jgi:hypothetical protein
VDTERLQRARDSLSAGSSACHAPGGLGDRVDGQPDTEGTEMSDAGRLSLIVGKLHRTISTGSSFDDIYVGLEGTFEIRIDDEVLYETEVWNGVEFAAALDRWLDDPGDAFTYQSIDADDPWLVRFAHEAGGWRVEAWHDHRADQLLPLEDVVVAARACVAAVDAQLRADFDTELASYTSGIGWEWVNEFDDPDARFLQIAREVLCGGSGRFTGCRIERADVSYVAVSFVGDRYRYVLVWELRGGHLETYVRDRQAGVQDEVTLRDLLGNRQMPALGRLDWTATDAAIRERVEGIAGVLWTSVEHPTG